MRDRLVATFVGLTLLVLALFALPSAYVLADVVQDQEQERTDRTAALVASAVDERLASGSPVDRRFLAALLRPGEQLAYAPAGGGVTTVGDAADARLRSTARLEAGGEVTLSRSQRSVADQVSEDVLPLALLALGLALAAGVLGVTVARRFARPFDQLADVAAAIGSGRFDTPVPRFGGREADDLGRTLRDTAHRLELLVRRERSLAVTASHELRTPITALRLSLEDLTLWRDVTPAVAAELQRAIAEVDRLGAAVTHLLEDRRDAVRDDETDVDLHHLVAEAAEARRDRLAADGRRLVVKGSSPVRTRTAVEPVRQVVEALLDHATERGSGTVTVDVTALRAVVRVRVSDQGARRVPSGVLHGDDQQARDGGLDAAATAAEASGGYLAAQDSPDSRLLLILPDRPTDA